MTNKQQFEKMKQEYLNMNIPEEGLELMKMSIDRAKKDKRRMHRRTVIRNTGLGMAAALAIAVALPNLNGNIAYAMSRIPVLGSFFEVVTFRSYSYEDDNNSAEVKIPQVTVEGSEGQAPYGQIQDSVDKINLDLDKITQELIDQFKKTVEEQGEGHTGLYVDHEVVTDNDRWFTLRLIVVEEQASGYEYYKYFTVDKQTGKTVSLADLFEEGSNYLDVLTQEIRSQMVSRMQADENLYYFVDDPEVSDSNFTQLKPDANFYFNAQGGLTIVFDEYDVAPGYMGPQEFVVDSDAVRAILK